MTAQIRHFSIGRKTVRQLAYGSVSGLALTLVSPALAQTPPDKNVEQVVVTSTRIQAAGFDAPTPTTIIGSDFIAKSAQTNLFTTIAQLPSLAGSTGTQIGNAGAGAGTNGLSAFNMRGIGTIRTLTLFDGQRVVGANNTGIADISEFPQLLTRRVDVVTGGASASYGSDAIAGVINFITVKKFDGYKANVSGGISTYGDNETAQVQLAGGTSFFGGRAHVEASAEYSYEAGIPPGGLGIKNGPNGRDWYAGAAFLTYPLASTPAGQPQNNYAVNVQSIQFAQYGLITSGPLQGIAFSAAGTPSPFQYGTGPTGVQGVPSHAANGAVTNCVVSSCIGGDNSGNFNNTTSIATATARGNLYVRASYDLDDNNEIWATAMASQVYTRGHAPGSQRQNATLTIQCDNAFLPASIAAACKTNNIASFGYGIDSVHLATPHGGIRTQRDLRRYAAGADGSFNLFGSHWSYDSYYEHGENDISLLINQLFITPRLKAAIDAVNGPNGTIVCRSAVAQGEGCLPINIIGGATPLPAAFAWVAPPSGAPQYTTMHQDAASISVNGAPFSLWAGPVSIAIGAEYRQEGYNVKGDPYGAGVSAITPYNATYPADPLLDPNGNNWFAGNYHNGSGSYHVTEGFVELGVPLLDDKDFGKIDADLAGRATGYSTSGFVATWKTGLTWQTPLDGLKVRTVMSRDVRAPNLSELYAAPVSLRATITNDANGAPITLAQINIGNLNLQPEKSLTKELGVVFQPSWLPGFSASVDYWRVGVKNEIGNLSAQQEEDTCFASGGTSPVCGAIQLTGVSPSITVQAFNLASAVTDGFDIEASQQFDLENWGVPGDFSLRTIMTHVSKFITTPGVPNQAITETAGNNTGSTPLWRGVTTESWNDDVWGVNLTERWFSDGVFNKNFITCTSGCPATTIQNPTANYNKMDGAFYVDFGVTYKAAENLQLYTKIDNIANVDPLPAPVGASANGANASLYDVVGRMFHVGLRYTH